MINITRYNFNGDRVNKTRFKEYFLIPVSRHLMRKQDKSLTVDGLASVCTKLESEMNVTCDETKTNVNDKLGPLFDKLKTNFSDISFNYQTKQFYGTRKPDAQQPDESEDDPAAASAETLDPATLRDGEYIEFHKDSFTLKEGENQTDENAVFELKIEDPKPLPESWKNARQTTLETGRLDKDTNYIYRVEANVPAEEYVSLCCTHAKLSGRNRGEPWNGNSQKNTTAGAVYMTYAQIKRVASKFYKSKEGRKLFNESWGLGNDARAEASLWGAWNPEPYDSDGWSSRLF